MAKLEAIRVKKLFGNESLLMVTMCATKGLKIRIWAATKLFHFAGRLLNCRVEVQIKTYGEEQ